MKEQKIIEILKEELDVTGKDAATAAEKIAAAVKEEKQNDIRLLKKKTETFIKQVSKQLKIVKPA